MQSNKTTKKDNNSEVARLGWGGGAGREVSFISSSLIIFHSIFFRCRGRFPGRRGGELLTAMREQTYRVHFRMCTVQHSTVQIGHTTIQYN